MSDNEDAQFGEKPEDRDQNLIKYIYDLSKEMNVEGAHGIIGNELELIALVRNCPFLYDKKLSDYKDVHKKNIVWSAIASVLHCKVHEVKQRWRSLRDTYNRYKKDVEPQDVQNDLPCSWEYYEDMKFIDPYIFHRSTVSNTPESDNDEDSNSAIDANQKFENIQFILTVKSRPILYDSNHPHYKTKELKVEVWNEVAEEMNLTVSECEQRWKNLRERYGRERKMRHLHNKKKWEYFNVLNFLDVHIKPRRHSSFRPILPKTDENPNNMAIINPLNNHVSSNNSDLLLKHLNVSPTPNDLKHNSLPTHFDLQNIEFVDATSNLKSPSTTSIASKVHCKNVGVQNHSVVYDEDELFGQSISAELHRIPSGKKKMKIKAEIYKILYENESDN